MIAKLLNSVVKEFIEVDLQQTTTQVIDTVVNRFNLEKTLLIDEFLTSAFVKATEFKMDLIKTLTQLGFAIISVFMISVGAAFLIENYVQIRGLGFIIIGVMCALGAYIIKK